MLTRLYKPLWVPVDDVAAQLSPKFQSQRSKALEVMTQKVAEPPLTVDPNNFETETAGPKHREFRS
jgi:hypothetical protein